MASEYTLEKYAHSEGEPFSRVVYRDAPLLCIPAPLQGKRVLDIGCGNGYWSNVLQEAGADVTGIEPAVQGVELARKNYPRCRFEQLAASEDILQRLGVAPFDAVMSIEVVEHLYDPRTFARTCFAALRPGGVAIVSTPYNGYLKNIAVAAAGKYDKHVNPLWDGGHVKFWSKDTLTKLLEEAGFRGVSFVLKGRVPFIRKGMIARAVKPG